MKPWAEEQIRAALASPDSGRVSTAGSVQRTAHGPARSRCATCHEFLAGTAAQTRHLNRTGHARYEIDLDR